MSKFILVDPATTHSFDTEEEAVAFVKKRALEGIDGEGAYLNLGRCNPQSELLVCEATVVRKLAASIATSPGNDKMFRDIESERKAAMEAYKAKDYYNSGMEQAGMAVHMGAISAGKRLA
jgi:hypothetical protein